MTGYLKIELLKTGKVINIINASVANSGTYSWNIPAEQPIVTGYHIKRTPVTDVLLFGQSSADFTISTGEK